MRTGRREVDARNVQRYDVFRRDGRWLSSVHVPRELGYIREIGDDYLLMAWADELGVPHIRLYRLEKPAGAGTGTPAP